MSMEKEEKEREKELEKAKEKEREKAERSKDDSVAARKAGNFLRKTRQWSSLCMDEVKFVNFLFFLLTFCKEKTFCLFIFLFWLY